MSDEKQEFDYVLVGNIPSKFHSVDLRSFFSEFVETEQFQCFHFRHRPEVLKRQKDLLGDLGQSENERTIKGKTTCCIVCMRTENIEKFLTKYDGENWIDRSGKLLTQKAVISTVLIQNNNTCKLFLLLIAVTDLKIKNTNLFLL